MPLFTTKSSPRSSPKARSSSPKARSSSPKGRSSSPKGRSSSPLLKPKKSLQPQLRSSGSPPQSFAKLREETLQNFVNDPNQDQFERVWRAYERSDKQSELAKQVASLLTRIQEAQDLYNATIGKVRFKKEQVELARKLLNESPVRVPITYNDMVAEQLKKVLSSGKGPNFMKKIAEIETAIIDNPDLESDEKLKLLQQLEEIKQKTENPTVLQAIERVAKLLQFEPQGEVVDLVQQPFYQDFEKLLEKLGGIQSFVLADKERYVEKANAIAKEIEEFANYYGFQGVELQQLKDMNDEMYRKINSIPVKQVQRRQAPVEYPLLTVDDLRTDRQVKDLLRSYSNQLKNPNATQVQKDNIAQNLRVIADYVRESKDIHLPGYLSTVLKQAELTLYEPQNFQELRQVIDNLEWPEREDFEIPLAEYEQTVQENFRVILEIGYFREAFERFTTNTTNPEKSSCVASKQLDLHQLFAIAWFYCSGSTGVFNFFSTGSGKTATAWATLRMYRDQVKVGDPNSVKLIWVTLDNLINDAWKDSWAYSDIMIGYEPGNPTAEQIAERARIEGEVWFVTYKIFDALIRKAEKTNKERVEKRYGIKIKDKLLPTQLNNSRIIIDEAQYLVEPPSSAKTFGVQYETIMDFFSTSYQELEPEERPKLCVLSATPSVTDVSATPKLLNLLIHDQDYRLPTEKEKIEEWFTNGQWADGRLEEWNDLSRGLTVCYDGHGDKSLFAQKHVNPMIVVRGNEGQLQAIERCKKDNKCKRAIVDYVAVEKDGSGYTLPANISPVSSQFKSEIAENKLFQQQQAIPEPKLVKKVVKK